MVFGHEPLETSLTWVTTGEASQLSLTEPPAKFATGTSASHWTVVFPGQTKVGAVVSMTVTVKVQVTELLARSAAVMVTSVAPVVIRVPAAGDCVITTAPQRSVATTSPVTFGSATRQAAFADRVRFVAQVVMDGGVVSSTATVKVQALVLPEPSVAVQVTTLVPRAKVLPLTGTQTTEGEASQVSVADAVKVTTAPLELVHSATMFVEQVATGAVVS